MRITIAKRLINNYSSRARLRSVRRSRATFTSASDRSIISCLVERLLAYTLYIANRDNGLSGYLSAVCARVADVSSIVDIGNRLRAPEISRYKLFAPIFRHYQQRRFYAGIQSAYSQFFRHGARQRSHKSRDGSVAVRDVRQEV